MQDKFKDISQSYLGMTPQDKDCIRDIAQSYLGMTPQDKGCNSWAEMQDKMTNELMSIKDLKSTSEKTFGDVEWYAENGTVYNTDDDLDSIVVLYNRDNGSYMSLPQDVAEKIAEMLNCR